jgi:hypothetical protein
MDEDGEATVECVVEYSWGEASISGRHTASDSEASDCQNTDQITMSLALPADVRESRSAQRFGRDSF